MKEFGLWLGLLVSSLSAASAQVTVEILQEQDQFLPGESVPAAVRIINRAGQTLRLGKEQDWLTFSVESLDGMVAAKTGEVPVAGEFVLDSSKMATKRVDLAPYFSLGVPGHYTVLATVRIKDWDHRVTSPPKGFDIIQGAKLWEQEFGVPEPAGATNAAPEVRRYILQQANYLKGELRLYLRVTDASGAKVFRVFPIGRMLSFSRPEAQVDKLSNLHVLFANGPHSFNYTIFSPDGEVLARRTYDFLNSRPRLQVDAAGTFSVAGGVRRMTATDLPALGPATQPNDAQTSKP